MNEKEPNQIDAKSNSKSPKQLSMGQKVAACLIAFGIYVGYVVWHLVTEDPNTIVQKGIELHSGYFFGAGPNEIREFDGVINGAFKIANKVLPSAGNKFTPFAVGLDENGKQAFASFVASDRQGMLTMLKSVSKSKHYKTVVLVTSSVVEMPLGDRSDALIFEMENEKGTNGAACLPYKIGNNGEVDYERMREFERAPLEVLFARDHSVRPNIEFIPAGSETGQTPPSAK